MACLGVHFALTKEQADHLLGTPDDDVNAFLLEFIEEIQEARSLAWRQPTEHAWDAIHRCLTDGQLKHGLTPFHNCILGSGNLYDGGDYVVNFLNVEEVKEVAAVLVGVDR